MWVVGDVHGCYEQLGKIYNRINGVECSYDEPLRAVFIGDYIDRGPQSKDCVEFLMMLTDKFKNIICLRGNHEQMLLDAWDGVHFNPGLWLQNGGGDTLISYGMKPGQSIDEWKNYIPQSHIDWIRNLPLQHEDEDHIYVHAGLVPPDKVWMEPYDERLWVRDQFISSDHDFGKKVIFGHTIMPELLVRNNKIGIDTGCFATGKLTAVKVENGQIVDECQTFNSVSITTTVRQIGALPND